MRYAVFSDIHGNLEALEAVLRDMGGQSMDRLVCLGDLVGYGASPNECIRTVIESGAEVVLGNHDQAAVTLDEVEEFNDYARAAIYWTHGCLTPESIDYLSGLPLVITHPGVRFVHASPGIPDNWTYVLTLHQAAAQLDAFPEPVCFIGHSHYPGLFFKQGSRHVEIDFPPGVPIPCPGSHCLVNGGSVGQPRDNDWRAAWVSFDDETRELMLHRVEYPVEIAQRRIIDSGLPPFLAERLRAGM